LILSNLKFILSCDHWGHGKPGQLTKKTGCPVQINVWKRKSEGDKWFISPNIKLNHNHWIPV
ncbi:MAG: hypothetical protein ACK559_27425, partial [bacterium]